jgi:5'-nucleotidase
MRVLLTNDDGIGAPGIASLLSEICKPGLDIEIVAPAVECSAIGHSISLRQPIKVHRVKMPCATDCHIDAYSVEGTPADCVKYAVTTLFTQQPIDLVVSGINRGPNIGINIFYSGTVAAVMEAAIQGVAGIAVSVGFPDGTGNPAYGRAAEMTAQLVSAFSELAPLPPVPMWNINFPDESKPIEGVVLTRQSGGGFREAFQHQATGELWPRTYQVTGEYQTPEGDIHNDSVAIHDGYISVTPLGLDLTYNRPAVPDLPDKFHKAIAQTCRKWGLRFID